MPGITEAVREHADSVKAYVVREELTEVCYDVRGFDRR